MTRSVVPTGERQLCTFRVDDYYFGIDVLDVQEVLYHEDITEVPHSPPAVTGLINLRGQIATAIDLAARLELEGRTEGGRIHVVVRHRGQPVSLLVDQIGDVISVLEDIFEPPPETMRGAIRDLITGAYKLDEQLLLTLDVERVISALTPALGVE